MEEIRCHEKCDLVNDNICCYQCKDETQKIFCEGCDVTSECDRVKELSIDGVLSFVGYTSDEVIDMFLDFCNENNLSFGGGFNAE